MIVEESDLAVIAALSIMLPGEGRAFAHLEVAGGSAQHPLQVSVLAIELIDRVRVAGRDEQRLPVVVDGHRVQVDVVERLLLGAFAVLELRLRLVDGNVIESPPFDHGFAGGDVDLLDDSLPDPAVLRTSHRAAIRLGLDVGQEKHRVVVGDRRLVQIRGLVRQVPTHADPGDLVVAVIEHDDLACRFRGLRQTFPPGEDRFVLVFLDP